MEDLSTLIALIGETQSHFRRQAQKQVNTALSLRNWLFGLYIVEYEQRGADRAEYGDNLIDRLSKELTKKHQKGFSAISLRLYRSFYVSYPHIQQSATVELYFNDIARNTLLRTASARFIGDGRTGAQPIFEPPAGVSSISIDTLINQLSFTHIVELLKINNATQRSFYEVEAVKNNWSVRELQRAMNSMLYERTGLSTNKEAVLEKAINQERLLPEDVFRNPYMLEFLGLKEEAEYSETQLEEAIINHLQSFLLEMGRGFCFEARQ